MSEELTDAQSEKVDHIHSVAYNAMKELLGEEIEWDMEWIGIIADELCNVAIGYFGKTEISRRYQYDQVG
jgi:hypothetical protein